MTGKKHLLANGEQTRILKLQSLGCRQKVLKGNVTKWETRPGPYSQDPCRESTGQKQSDRTRGLRQSGVKEEQEGWWDLDRIKNRQGWN